MFQFLQEAEEINCLLDDALRVSLETNKVITKEIDVLFNDAFNIFVFTVIRRQTYFWL